ncbi:hypothetical protein CR513_25177, partial [Mucuna pruriens]
MASISTIHAPELQSLFVRNKCPRVAASWITSVSFSWFLKPLQCRTMDSDFPNKKKKKKQVSVQLSSLKTPVMYCGLRFDRLQPSDDELDPHNRFEFGNFVARPAMLEEEYWIAAWLRAECEWENQEYHTLYSDDCKRRFADQEFTAIKKRCEGQNVDSSACIITVRKEKKNVKRTIIKSVVGTLDLSIRYLLKGETFPGELVDAPRFCRMDRTPSARYAYISNVCVSKSARRKGIASNMLYFAIQSAKSAGVPRVYAHVNRYNNAAKTLYQNLGFEVVEMANPLLIESETYLLRLEI